MLTLASLNVWKMSPQTVNLLLTAKFLKIGHQEKYRIVLENGAVIKLILQCGNANKNSDRMANGEDPDQTVLLCGKLFKYKYTIFATKCQL